ncbi:NAD(P)/FAD-dependent oxidoreductase [Emticicia sp. BO119]|uniref:NAD(P)/FAD-dependent oxidoreductase n=1 Tax=Emticicia sp. BO119 TaxID=2757768 RepID=UPI0015F02BD1|nr:NAD(P)/FAD-dependent oxidoreductase [Emticicia sp. BO119]MBA4851024.1 FAD-dependent oxidoreductase [Emticicia sp. BO119]
MNDFSTVIIGGGISGLTCAKYLNEKGMSFVILESSDALGGRVRTDMVEGFRLDRGFQTLLANYSEARKILNYSHLDLNYFESGVLIKAKKGFTKLESPFKDKGSIFSKAFSPIGSWSDRLKIKKFAKYVADIPDEELFGMDDIETIKFLKKYGWSKEIIQQFFKPFFGSIFHDNELHTSSNLFHFVFKQFFKGEMAIPAEGIQAIPEQISDMISKEKIRLNTIVKGIEDNKVFLENGKILTADRIVIATDPLTADRFLDEDKIYEHQLTTCTYFSAEYSPLKGQKYLTLNPDRKGVVHNLFVPTDISPSYGTTGKTLISVSTHGLEKIDERNHISRIKREVYDWFGAQVNVWKHIRTYHIPDALPKFPSGTKKQPLKLNENLYRCGDYLAYPSLNAAMQTGREVAEMISEI